MRATHGETPAGNARGTSSARLAAVYHACAGLAIRPRWSMLNAFYTRGLRDASPAVLKPAHRRNRVVWLSQHPAVAGLCVPSGFSLTYQ